ncbi:MAG TPA: polymer-forming cytoskeletal protein [Gammaproteobacteria bacterium]|nr:polymer-forming cytoskeletal protein [Gammaproteobacteria bacterium]
MFEIGKKGTPDSGSRPESSPARTESTAPRSSSSSSSGMSGREAAVIGPSIHIDGDVRGEEDLLIDGEVSGTVQLKNNSLTVGPNGKVKADVYAHSIYVDGYLEGDLYGSERVNIRKSAQVRGNVTSPRVSLEDGAKFKGSIEMDPQAAQNVVGRAVPKSASAPSAAKPVVAQPVKPDAPAVKTGVVS